MIIYIIYNSILTRLFNYSNSKILKFIIIFFDENLASLLLSFSFKTKSSFDVNVVLFRYRVYISENLIFKNCLIQDDLKWKNIYFDFEYFYISNSIFFRDLFQISVLNYI